jgi:hypothetical protein
LSNIEREESPQRAAKRQSSGRTEADVIARLVREGKVVSNVDHRRAVNQLAGAVDLIRELHGILAPPEVDDPSAVPIAVDKIEAWLDAHGGQ